MVTSLLSEPTEPAPARQNASIATDFRLLGLRPREARLEVIRQALRETASELQTSDSWAAEDEDRLARVATAGYRLLDPRRRRSLFERVQLLLWTEDDLAPKTGTLLETAPEPTASSLPTQIIAESACNPLPPPVISTPTNDNRLRPSKQRRVHVNHQAEEAQAALELFRSLRRRDRNANILWVGVVALALSLTLALGIVTAILL